MIPVREIDHLVLRVRDLDAMLAFYTGVLAARWRRCSAASDHTRAFSISTGKMASTPSTLEIA